MDATDRAGTRMFLKPFSNALQEQGDYVEETVSVWYKEFDVTFLITAPDR